jgi:hypothetical protein
MSRQSDYDNDNDNDNDNDSDRGAVCVSGDHGSLV